MSAERIYGFVQFEYPGPLGPGPGRFVVRRYAGDDPQHVLVLTRVGTAPPARRGLGARRAREARPQPGPPRIEATRATVVDADPLSADAEGWLRRAVADRATVSRALAVLNRALAAHRLGTADPYVAEVRAERALTIRVGYGDGDAVADGRWIAARELAAEPPGRPRRSTLLRPQERLAALLGGRDAALACEELALRARLDLDQGREREATLVLEAALRIALAELAGWRGARDVDARLPELEDRRRALAPLAEAAVRGGLAPEQRAAVAEALGRLEAALRARLAATLI